jgi:hypothetical protein
LLGKRRRILEGTVSAAFNMMNSAAIPILLTDQKHESSHERCRRGSLPLKKRRFSMEEDTIICSTDDPDTNASSHNSLAVFSEQTMMMSAAGDDEKIAALALVAAASSTYAPVANVTTPSVDSSETSLKIEEAPKDALCNNFAFDLPPTSSKRIHRPPLSSPLPGGCHGRTSRNNSYCRRHPCYNGSKYCKLHYQHYIVAGLRTPMDEEEVEDAIPLSIEKNQSISTSQPTAHQDKRYTGSVDGTRCLATTTRGRVCAYVSVNTSKYCYLHADYDTNPPPKRGGGGQRVKASGHGGESPFRLGGDLHLSTFEALPSVPSGVSAAEVSVASPASVASEESRLASPVTASGHGKRSLVKPLSKKTLEKALVEQSPNKGSRKSASKLAEKHAGSPFPLLSMISTDQWFHKTVVISTGPLADQSGKVEKWGNGWVSVSVPGVGLHNRRSFELYLQTEDQCERASASIDSDGKMQESNPSLLRCITSGAASPLPSSDGILERSLSLDARSKTASLAKVRSSDSSRRSSFDQASYPTEVPETPRPDRESLKMQDSVIEGTPISKTAGDQARGGPQVPHVTPSSPRKIRNDDIPLIETLQLAAEGCVTKYNLGLLFGTAALERGRRTLKKVTRYEDTAMLGNKRGRKVSPEGETETSAKKNRSVA